MANLSSLLPAIVPATVIHCVGCFSFSIRPFERHHFRVPGRGRIARKTSLVDGNETDRDLVLLFTYKTSRGTYELFAREIAVYVIEYEISLSLSLEREREREREEYVRNNTSSRRARAALVT
jgi:hypothetical protein